MIKDVTMYGLLAAITFVSFSEGVNVQADRRSCPYNQDAWKCEASERGGGGGGRGRGDRGFWIRCEKEVKVTKGSKETVTIARKIEKCLIGNPHNTNQYFGLGPPRYYNHLLEQICPTFRVSRSSNSLKIVGLNTRQLLYDEVDANSKKTTGREFSRDEVAELRRNGNMEIPRYGTVTFQKGVKRVGRGYQEVKYVAKPRVESKKYMVDNYGIEWNLVPAQHCKDMH